MTIHTLASSSSGNCTLVSQGASHVLIDAGISLKRIKEGLKNMDMTPDDLTAVLVTHEHSDHISGIKMLVKYHKIPIFASIGAQNSICASTPEVAPYLSGFKVGTAFELGEIAMNSFNTPHDATESVGFTLDAGGNMLAYATDLGHISEEVFTAMCGADIVIIESNHDQQMLQNGPYPPSLKRRIASKQGHLSNSACGSFAVRLVDSGTRYIQLSHLSRENNTPKIAARTVSEALGKYGISVGQDIELDVASPYTAGRVYDL
ncbi:MAG: MBL fold metallo-hydrolase [Oscillospiraceae bacterium]|nr:MBL fold metallo-hydrolase [Oscillospiraceae bacterium]